MRPATPSVRSRARGLDVHLLLPLDPLGQAPHLVRLALPGGHRVAVGGEARAVVEVLVLGQGHPGLAGVGVGGEERQGPAVLAGRRAPHRGLHQRLARLLGAGLLLRVRLRQLAGVRLGHDRDPHVGVLRRPGGGRREPSRAARRRRARRRPAPAPSVRELHDRQPARPAAPPRTRPGPAARPWCSTG